MEAVVRGISFCLLLFLTSFFGSLVFLLPFLPLVCFDVTEKFGRWIMDNFIFLWKLFSVALYEVMMGVKIKVDGQELPTSNKGLLIIMNHRTRLDWLFLMSYQLRHASLLQYNISLKDMLKKIPGPGWAMQCGAFLFLQRKWEVDRVWITKCMQYFQRVEHKPQLLFFPEGTDFTKYSKEKSDKFAEKIGVNKYNFVIHPRTTGFIHMVNEMREKKLIDGVIDVTVGYPKYILQNEGDIVNGKFPEEINFHVSYFDISELPTNSDSVGEWCQQRWMEKEKNLSLFYEKKQFTANKESNLDGDEDTIRNYLYCAIVFWSVFLCFVLYGLLFVGLFRWYCLIAIIIFLAIQTGIGGVDNLLFTV